MMWSLTELLQDYVECDHNIAIADMTLDSRSVKENTLFVALQGTQCHGLTFAEQAISAGASAILWESTSDEQVQPWVAEIHERFHHIPCIEIADLSQKLGGMADRFYKKPSSQLSVVGVTGTDGKTSTCHFIAQCLNQVDRKSAFMGTIGLGIPGSLATATHTTPDVIRVHAELRRLVDEGFVAVAMEVSSHALDQGRVNAVDFDVVVLTNLTRDHLDYHLTLEAYAEAKAKLFTQFSKPIAVLNLDDDFGQVMAELMQQHGRSFLSYQGNVQCDREKPPLDGLLTRHYAVTNASYSLQGILATIILSGQTYAIETDLLGDFNLANILSTLAVLHALGIDDALAVAAVNRLTCVPGRMDKVAYQQGVLVVVDYAHTPGALSSSLKALKKHTRNRIICVFGCGGDRDNGKRPLMGGIAEEHAQMVIITDDNPRNESPFRIMNDIISGLKQPEHVAIEHDRAKAIRFAISQAESGDSVLIAGKGHETYQIVGDEALDFDDREEALLVLHTEVT